MIFQMMTQAGMIAIPAFFWQEYHRDIFHNIREYKIFKSYLWTMNISFYTMEAQSIFVF